MKQLQKVNQSSPIYQNNTSGRSKISISQLRIGELQIKLSSPAIMENPKFPSLFLNEELVISDEQTQHLYEFLQEIIDMKPQNQIQCQVEHKKEENKYPTVLKRPRESDNLSDKQFSDEKIEKIYKQQKKNEVFSTQKKQKWQYQPSIKHFLPKTTQLSSPFQKREQPKILFDIFSQRNQKLSTTIQTQTPKQQQRQIPEQKTYSSLNTIQKNENSIDMLEPIVSESEEQFLYPQYQQQQDEDEEEKQQEQKPYNNKRKQQSFIVDDDDCSSQDLDIYYKQPENPEEDIIQTYKKYTNRIEKRENGLISVGSLPHDYVLLLCCNCECFVKYMQTLGYYIKEPKFSITRKKVRYIFNKFLVKMAPKIFFYDPSENISGYHYNSYAKSYNYWRDNFELPSDLVLNKFNFSEVIDENGQFIKSDDEDYDSYSDGDQEQANQIKDLHTQSQNNNSSNNNQKHRLRKKNNLIINSSESEE